jgi:hypothetical protein
LRLTHPPRLARHLQQALGFIGFMKLMCFMEIAGIEDAAHLPGHRCAVIGLGDAALCVAPS